MSILLSNVLEIISKKGIKICRNIVSAEHILLHNYTVKISTVIQWAP